MLRGRQGQAAIEYLALIGFLLLISAPLVIEAQRSTVGLQESTDQLRVVSMLDMVEDASMLVYAQGEPARITFDVTVPQGVNETVIEETYAVVTYVGTSGPTDYVRTFPFNVSGDLPDQAGQHVLVAEAEGRTNVTIQPQ